jgi:hypothetical protein
MDIFRQVKELLDIKYVLDVYGVPTDAKGAALCPFHREKTKSFKLYENSFYCFGCGTGGTVIDFVMKTFGLTELEAAQKLDTDFGLNLADKNPKRVSQKLIAKAKEDKNIISDFGQWERDAFTAVSSYFRALTFWGRMYFVENIKYFERHLSDIENIVFVENLLDLMILNTNNLEEQINFYNDFERQVSEIEQRTREIGE